MEEQDEEKVLQRFMEKFPAWERPGRRIARGNFIKCGGQPVYLAWNHDPGQWEAFIGFLDREPDTVDVWRMTERVCVVHADTPEKAVDEFARLCSGIVHLMKFAL